MKTITKLGLTVIEFMANAVFNNAVAQKYDGSAYVQVKDYEEKSGYFVFRLRMLIEWQEDGTYEVKY